MHRVFTSIGHAIRGIRAVWHTERSFRIEAVAALVFIAATFVLGFTFLETLLVLFAVGMILGAELMNTVIEDVLDIIQPSHDVRVGRAKDMMAGAVLLTVIGGILLLVFTAMYHYRI